MLEIFFCFNFTPFLFSKTRASKNAANLAHYPLLYIKRSKNSNPVIDRLALLFELNSMQNFVKQGYF